MLFGLIFVAVPEGREGAFYNPQSHRRMLGLTRIKDTSRMQIPIGRTRTKAFSRVPCSFSDYIRKSSKDMMVS